MAAPHDPQGDVLPVKQTKRQTKAFYNRIARFYDLFAERSEQPMREAGLRKLAACRGERILEIGFGTGHNLVRLAKQVGPAGRVFGVDISEQMLAIAEARLKREQLGERVQLACADAEQLPLESDSLDGVMMSFALELFDTPNIACVLAECRRVLRPGGRVVVVAVSKEGRPSVTAQVFEWLHQHLPSLMDCRPIYVRRAVEAAGFQIQAAGVASMWVPVEIVLGRKSDVSRPAQERDHVR